MVKLYVECITLRARLAMALNLCHYLWHASIPESCGKASGKISIDTLKNSGFACSKTLKERVHDFVELIRNPDRSCPVYRGTTVVKDISRVSSADTLLMKA